jgi:hypothetical protein
MHIRNPMSVTDRSQINIFPADPQILKGRATWRNLPSIFLILHDFDYLLLFFSVSTSSECRKKMSLPKKSATYFGSFSE